MVSIAQAHNNGAIKPIAHSRAEPFFVQDGRDLELRDRVQQPIDLGDHGRFGFRN
jgi:hypothetical protein